MSFRDDFARTPWGPQREQLVYREVLSQGKPTDLIPMTVPGPDGSKVTYYITRDFLKADGQYLPMSATTAQQVANAFDMFLPSNTIADQVWKAAQAAGSVVNVPPLSGTGYRGANGQWYSAQDVVASRISATDAAVEYSKRVSEALAGNPKTQTGPIDIGSGVKWLTMPPANGSIGLHGIRQGDSTVQGGYGTIHQDYEEHTEYGTYVRLVGDRIIVTKSDGSQQPMSMEEFSKSPFRSALFVAGQDLRDGRLATYDVNRDKAGLARLNVEKHQSREGNKGVPSLEEVNKFIDSLMTEIASVRCSMKRYAVLEDSVLDPSKAVLPSEYGYHPGVPPPGYGAPDFSRTTGFKGRAPKAIEDMAKQVLHTFLADRSEHPIGTMIPFSVDGHQYMARAEVHSNSPYGISVYEATSGNGTQGRMKLLQRIQDSPDVKSEDVEKFLSEFEKEL
jgi:hypothetical protein